MSKELPKITAQVENLKVQENQIANELNGIKVDKLAIETMIQPIVEKTIENKITESVRKGEEFDTHICKI